MAMTAEERYQKYKNELWEYKDAIICQCRGYDPLRNDIVEEDYRREKILDRLEKLAKMEEKYGE